MTSKEPAFARSVATYDDFSPAPIDPTWIIEGTPQARSRPLSLAVDGTIKAELWDCSAGRFDWHYGSDELIHILEGGAELTSSRGSVTRIGPGDIVYFSPGQTVRWHVPEYVKKLALFSIRVSLPRRIAQRIPFARRIVHFVRASRAGVLAIFAGTFQVLPELATRL